MDINSLLSPDVTPAGTPSPRTTPATHQRPPTSTPTSSSQQLSPSSQPYAPPPTNNGVAETSMSPPKRPQAMSQRSPSGMDTLADLASMQHSQRGPRPNPAIVRTHDGDGDKQHTTNAVRPSLESIARANSGSRSSLDIHMEDAPMQIPESRAFKSDALSEENLILVQQLTSYLAENPNAYESHLQLIKILRHGFLSHVYSTDESPEEQDPTTYDLLAELRQAREAMASRFTMGEEPWLERLKDEMITARSLEDCLHVVELCEKSVADETGSTKLWSIFGDWELALYSAANPDDENVAQMHNGLNQWINFSEDDRSVIAEVFGKLQVTDVWKRAAEDVKYNINDSRIIWDRYTDLLELELGPHPSSETLIAMREHFIDRLRTPHSGWDDTFQRFSTFTSKYDSQGYEGTMVETKKMSRRARELFNDREVFEIELNKAEDSTTIWTTINRYLEWEISQPRKKKQSSFSFELANALYQRATLMFPSDTNLWEDHLVLLGEENENRKEQIPTLTLLGKACGHCPWSGKLWSLYIQAAERQNLSFADITQIKHKATSTGLLDSTSMDDMLTIYTAYCSYLRRRAFAKQADDEEIDVAEVGIRSAIEDMESLGRRKEGKGYKGDPLYRLERIYVKFLAQCRKFDLARSQWNRLTARHDKECEFWLRWYTWEMHCWSYELGKTGIASARMGPTEPSKVLSRAAKMAVKTDWPEKILETYLVHCQDHEDVVNIDAAMIVWKRSMREVTKRREKEATEYAEQQQALADAQAQNTHDTTPVTNGHNIKRKRQEGDDDLLIQDTKKTKGENSAESEAHSSQTQSIIKRDRENSTVIVRNLPRETPENWVQHYFTECGTIKSILLSKDESKGTTIANIEFESQSDALSALTKDRKSFHDNVIRVSLGTGTTLYVTNFPPQADEAWIRDMFEKYGDIVDIRFPSLKYNTHRRFCYIQYTSSSAASQAAKECDNTSVEGDLKLVAKLSDPSHKEQRHGAQHEGREVFIKNLDWNASEDEIQALFKTYGEVERVRIIKGPDGRSKGFGYVVLSTKDEADASLILGGTKFKTRILAVSIADPNPSKHSTKPNHKSASPAANTNGNAASASSAASPQPQQSTSKTSDRLSRTIALINIPDTVNTVRLSALLEPYGTIEEITLRPAHQGAVVSFETAAAAGKASLGISGHEISPGRFITTGPVSELYKQKAEIKDINPGVKKTGPGSDSSKPGPSKASSSSLPSSSLLLSAGKGPIKRPSQPGSGASRRGGLGQIQRHGAAISSSDRNGTSNTSNGTNEKGSTGEGGGKSNDEFRKFLR